jgi:hypothetical protein
MCNAFLTDNDFKEIGSLMFLFFEVASQYFARKVQKISRNWNQTGHKTFWFMLLIL